MIKTTVGSAGISIRRQNKANRDIITQTLRSKAMHTSKEKIAA